MGTLAHHDLVKGKQDTTKGQELDATYHRLRQESPPQPQEAPERAKRR
jgi:hypothetical protein